MFPAQAGVIPQSGRLDSLPLSVPRAGGGDPGLCFLFSCCNFVFPAQAGVIPAEAMIAKAEGVFPAQAGVIPSAYHFFA